jgi:hypothetical protein
MFATDLLAVPLRRREQDTSQNNEDLVIAALLGRIEVPRYFVEFGVAPYEGNCIALHHQGWPGLFMDKKGGAFIRQEHVTPENINNLFAKYSVPEIGVLSIDIDGQDYWVWQAIEQRPPLVIIEYNGCLPLDKALVMPRDDNFVVTPGNQFYGASLLAMTKLGEQKGYVLVYSNGINAFFVRREEIFRAYKDAEPVTDLSVLARFAEI